MIVKMKKLTLIVSNKHKEEFLLRLRKSGVVHIKYISPPSSGDITYAEERISLLNRAINILPKPERDKEGKGLDLNEEDVVKRAEEIIEKHREKESIQRAIQDISVQMEWFKPWGGFDPGELERLKKENVDIKLYRLRKDEFRKVGDEYKERIYIIKKLKNYIYLAFISSQAGERLPFDEVGSPEKSFDALGEEKSYFNERLGKIEYFLEENAFLGNLLKKHILQLQHKLEFLNVKFGMKNEGEFSYLQGFCPQEDLSKVVSLVKSEGVGYFVEEPDNPNETPTFVKNPRWISIIEPLFKFMNTLPGYNEYDISFPFLLFFSVFFAMLIGDAGYGILLFIITLIARRRLKEAPKAPFFLMYLLSIATITWGAASGTWFGFEKISQMPIFNVLVVDRINSFVVDNQNFMICLCFIIGVVHLTVAHLIVAFRMLNSIKALAQVGWVLVLWGLFFAAGTLVLNNPFPPFAGYLLGAGIGLVLFFSNPQKNIIKGVLFSLLDAPLRVISSFSDIVSYLRLFAVGYATVIVASSFNDMALVAGFSNFLSGFGAALILFFGHVLNILLGLMSVIVHGIRLNMLEFSGHLGMQWSGKEYTPFKEE